jgi:hypothetical protein
MWKIDPKTKHIHKNKNNHVITKIIMFVIMGLLEGIRGKRKRKRE